MRNIREEFPQLSNYNAYLNTASTGLIPYCTINNVKSFINDLLEKEVNFSRALEIMDKCRLEVSKLINCSKEEVTFVDNTTHGLKIVLNMIKFREGDQVICFDLEYLGNVILLTSLSKSKGVKLKIIRHKNGFYDYDYLRKIVDKNTKAIFVSSVQWVNGLVMNLKVIKEIAENVGAYLIVDGIQHVGGIKLDVKKHGIDFLAVGSSKWLMAPYIGCGFLYINRELISELELPPYGLLNCKEPKEGWPSLWVKYDLDLWNKPLEIVNSGSKYEWGGTPPLTNIIALFSSVKYINDIGIDRIHEHNLKLKRELVNEVLARNWKIISFVEDTKLWSPTTLIKVNENYLYHKKLTEFLKNNRVIVSMRGVAGIWGVRISTHIYNTKEDISTLIDSIERYIKGMTK